MSVTKTLFRRLSRPLLGALALSTLAGTAEAAYPDHTITLVVPFTPAGSSDLLARIVATGLYKTAGWSVIVENRPGGGGNIGMTYVAHAKPDGYTFLVTSSIFVVNPSLYKPKPFDPFKDFVPVVDFGAAPNIILASSRIGVSNLAELRAYAKTHPNLNYSSAGTGTTANLTGELFKKASGINMLHIPYPGAAPASLAVLSGQVQLGANTISGVMNYLKDGSMKGIVLTGKERYPDLPDVPTAKEAGLGNLVAETFQAMFAPAGTPKDVIDLVAAKSIEVLKQPDVRKKLHDTAFIIVAGGPDVLAARVKREVPMWRAVIRDEHMVIQ